MNLHNINAAYSLAHTLYGVEPNQTEFEDIAINAWEKIGIKHTKLYKFRGCTSNQELQLPCNVDLIESVHLPIPDAQLTSNKNVYNYTDTLFTEGYIDAWKRLEDPLWTKGKLVKYREGDNTLYFSRNYDNVLVVYHGIIMDEETELPMVTDKELNAIAAYVAYTITYKNGIKLRDKTSLEIAQMLKQDWLKLCNAARTPDYLSQNDMDTILDAKVRWDRKQFGKSLKPML